MLTALCPLRASERTLHIARGGSTLNTDRIQEPTAVIKFKCIHDAYKHPLHFDVLTLISVYPDKMMTIHVQAGKWPGNMYGFHGAWLSVVSSVAVW